MIFFLISGHLHATGYYIRAAVPSYSTHYTLLAVDSKLIKMSFTNMDAAKFHNT